MKAVTIVAMGDSRRFLLDGVLSQNPDLSAQMGNAFGGEVWAINSMGAIIRADRVIMMDDLEDLQARSTWQPEIWERLKSLTVPLITSRPHPDFPTSEAYPLEKVIKGGLPYLNTTPAYAIALAMAEGFDVIRLYGVDFSYDIGPYHEAALRSAAHIRQAMEDRDPAALAEATRHWSIAVSNMSIVATNKESGRACVEWWIGLAMGRGIKIEVPWGCTLLDSNKGVHFYGYRDQPRPPAAESDQPGAQAPEMQEAA